MSYLNGFDYTVIGLYFAALVGLGLILQRKASASIEDYFIGGRKLPWWALGVSGMASFLDVTGTMIIVSFLFMLGPRGLFIEFRGGAVLVLAFMMLWGGKWHRRSRCLTGAEWMIFRFGDGPGGRFAQFMAALAGVVSTVGMLAYLVIGIGKFLSMFLPFTPMVCAASLVAVATVYTMVSGFYGVVFTDLFQSAIILIAVVFISVMAILKIGGVEDFGVLAAQVTGNGEWMNSLPQWKTSMPSGYEQYEALMMFAGFYLLKNVILGFSSGGDPKYFGARNDRECGLLTLMWTILMTVRWPMMMGFAVLGVFLVHDLFPDPHTLAQAADLIKANCDGVAKEQWADLLSRIIHQPEAYPQALIAGLQQILGDDWTHRLRLVGFEGTVDPERILPAVLLFDIPAGMRGLLLIALLAACMSTFDSTVNMTTGFITRDIYQKHIRPQASTKELIYVSWAAVAGLVIAGFAMAYSVESINDIWGWIIMGLGGGLMMPALLRLYWWRFNGGGFAVGTAAGMAAAILQRWFYPDLDERLQFLIIGAIGLAGSIAGTWLTPPSDHAVVERFYRITRPFGLWGPFRKSLPEADRIAMRREHVRDLLASPFALLWQITMFMLPMQIVVQAWSAFYVTLAFFLLGLGGMYIFWFRHLPAENYFEPDERDTLE